MENDSNILNKIDRALERMIERGYGTHPSFLSLKSKRDAIASGCKYTVIDVTTELIGGFGAAICALNAFRDGRYAGDDAIDHGVNRGTLFKENNYSF